MKLNYKDLSMQAVLFFIFVMAFNQLSAKTIFIDGQLNTISCSGNYSIANHACDGSDGDAYKTIAGAMAVAVAGDVIFIRKGMYNEQLAPQYSGTKGNFIHIKNHKNEQVTISGNSLNPAIWIDRKNYIIIEGITVYNVQRWLNALGCNHLIIQNNIFLNANDAGGSSKTGLFFQKSHYNKIINNTLDSTTQDNIGLVDSDYNLIEGNTITRGKHVLWAIKCGSYNVLRKNYFHNSLQKIGEIYDCDEVGYGSSEFPKISLVDGTKYNVVEDNIFAFTSTPINASPYAGIQYAGQQGIIRRNIFYDCIGPPIDLTLYSGEAEYNYGNKIYNNTMYNNHFGGIAVPGSASGYTCYDNMVTNNILYKNDFIQNDFRWNWYAELNKKPVQIFVSGSPSILTTSTTVFDNNNIFNSTPNELYLITYGNRTATANPPPYSLSWWETNHPFYFRNNLQKEPMFLDTASNHFLLQTKSPMIDAGRFLAKTIGEETQSTIMKVDDAGYFMDGYGIENQNGDTIQLQGQNEIAVITAINYANNTLTLNTPLSWKNGQALSLKYYGSATDLGAFEYNSGVVRVEKVHHTLSTHTFHIHPNPSTGIFTIQIYKPNANRLTITDMLGKIIYHKNNLTPESNPVDLSGQRKGVYVVCLEIDGIFTLSKLLLL